MSEFKVIETQEDFDAAIKGRLDQQSRKYSEEISTLRAELESLKTERASLIEKHTAFETEKTTEWNNKANSFEEQIRKLTSENSSLREAAVRREVVDKFNIPKEFADRLVGSDEASLSEDAEKLANILNAHSSSRMPRPDADVIPSEDTNTRSAFKEMLSKLN